MMDSANKPRTNSPDQIWKQEREAILSHYEDQVQTEGAAGLTETEHKGGKGL